MKLVVDLTGLQSQSRFRGIGRYTQGLIAGLARTAGPHEVWLAGSENLSEGLEAARSAFAGLIPKERIVSYRVLDQVQSGVAEHRWRRSASELVRDHFLGSMGADAILFSSMFEGFSDDAVTSCGDLCGSALRAVIAYDLIPLMNAAHYLANPVVKAWYYEKLAAFYGCDLFLAISQSAADELTNYLSIDRTRVASIMGGADEFAAALALAQDEDIDLDRRFGLTKPYFVYAASFDRRKNFENLIAAFARFSERVKSKHQLALVTSDDTFVVDKISEMVEVAGVDAADVVVTGQISDGELRALYRGSVALVHPSLHEGFGLPILEAMHLDTAVIGSNASSIPEIIGLEQALFDPTSVGDIADRMVRVAQDDAFRLRLQRNAVARRSRFSWDKTASAAWRALEAAWTIRRSGSECKASRASRYEALILALRRLSENGLSPTPHEGRALANVIARNIEVIDLLTPPQRSGGSAAWRIDGAADSSDEIARINREMTRALSALGKDVFLGPVGAASAAAAIVLRNGYPPEISDLDGACNIAIVGGWPDRGLPPQWVDQSNLHLDGMACPSAHMKKSLQDNGAAGPLAVIGQGVDHWERIVAAKAKSFPGKTFRFLHVSPCCPRSGVDVLLAAYGDTFRRDDDVTLIIKTSKPPANEIRSLLEAARAGDAEFPDVVLLFDELSDPELKALYGHCHALVAPSRTEAFGQALAQAMMSGVPVITTNWGGQLDFCTEQTAWLVDYSFAADGSSGTIGAVWAEPDRRRLAETLSAVRRAAPEARGLKAAAGRRVLLERYTWAAVADRLARAIDRWASSGNAEKPYVAWMAPKGGEGASQAYCAGLLKHLPLEAAIFAPLHDDGSAPSETDIEDLDLAAPDAVVIQLDPAPSDAAALERFVRDQKERSRTVLIDFHSGPLSPEAWQAASGLGSVFAMCDRLLVHTIEDLNRLKAMGEVENVVLLPYVAASPAADAGHERLSARLAGLIEALHRDGRDGRDGAAGGRMGSDLPTSADVGGRPAGLSKERIEMAPTELAPAEQALNRDLGQDHPDDDGERDFERLRREREALQRSLRGSLQKVRVLEGRLATAQAVEQAAPVPQAVAAPTEAVAAPEPPPAPSSPPASPGWRRRLALFAYRLVRPVVRPILWRLRGFIVAGVWEAEPSAHAEAASQAAATAETLHAMNLRLLEIEQALASVNVKLGGDLRASAEMGRLSQEMEKVLLSLAIGANNGLGAHPRDHLEN